MAKVSIGDVVFDVNPSTFSWGYSLETNSVDTYGGKVVQILSCSLQDCTVQGYLPVSKDLNNAYAEMERFEKNILRLMKKQADEKTPDKFDFPALGWSGTVYITQYGSVSYSYDLAAVTYTLQLSVDDGFSELRREIRGNAQASIDSIPNGVGWTRNIYNTPMSTTWNMSLEVVRKIIEETGNYQAVGLQDYYEMLREKVEQAKEESKSGVESVVRVAEESSETIANTVLSNGIGGSYGAMIFGAISGAVERGEYDASTTGYL